MASSDGYEIRRASSGGSPHFVIERGRGRLLAAVGNNQHRVWVYPVNTPWGIGVTQESPCDHVFHQSIFVGQAEVWFEGRQANFWASEADWRNPDNPIYSHIGQIRYHGQPSTQPVGDGFRFGYETTWRGENLVPIFDERRVIDVRDVGGGTLVDVTTSKTARYGEVEFRASKHGVIGVRVRPQLLPMLGGEVLGAQDGMLRRGTREMPEAFRELFVRYGTDLGSWSTRRTLAAERDQAAEGGLLSGWSTAPCGPGDLRSLASRSAPGSGGGPSAGLSMALSMNGRGPVPRMTVCTPVRSGLTCGDVRNVTGRGSCDSMVGKSVSGQAGTYVRG